MRTNLKSRFKKAMVTGGAGFVGSHLVDRLLAEGVEVVSIDDYSAGKAVNLRHARENHKGFKEVEADVSDMEALRPHFEGVDLVFHEACSKKTVCLKSPPRDLDVNGKGTLNMLLLARDAGVKKFVHASSGSVYGEAQYYPTDEIHPMNPTSYYGVSKLAGEKYVQTFHHLFDMDTTVLRYYHVFGPRQDSSDVGGVVSIFARRSMNDDPIRIFGDGEQLRSFTYVDDVVRINMEAAMNSAATGQAYNCASGVKVTIKELAERVKAFYGKENLEIRHEEEMLGDIRVFDVSNSKLKGLGFDFKYSFDDGLKRTLEWTREYYRDR